MNSKVGNQEKTSESFIQKNLKKHWKIISGIAILLVVIIYYNFVLYQTKNQLNKEKEILIEEYTNTIDSLKMAKVYEIVKVFSWAVRSELLRENFEQVDLLLSTFVKEPGFTRISLVNVDSQKVQLSTDKKLENEAFTEIELLKINELTVKEKRVIVPISGLNKQLGLLLVEFK